MNKNVWNIYYLFFFLYIFRYVSSASIRIFYGDTEQWPASILNHLFIDAPTPEIVKKVSAFLWKKVPFHIASYLYEICSEYTGDFATNIMHSYYFIWRSAKYSKKLAIYYNMRLKRYMHINGVCQSQIEPVIPGIPVIPLETAATNILNAIRVKLRLVKRLLWYSLKKTLFSSFQIMSIRSFVENSLGSLHNWPQDIIRYIFYIRPTYHTSSEIAVFFYGNKIPRDTALELFQEYNHPSAEHIKLFCEKYETWYLQKIFKHMSYYYNMRIGRMVHINGLDHDQMELADEDPEGIEIGFGDSFPDYVRRKIENTRGGRKEYSLIM